MNNFSPILSLDIGERRPKNKGRWFLIINSNYYFTCFDSYHGLYRRFGYFHAAHLRKVKCYCNDTRSIRCRWNKIVLTYYKHCVVWFSWELHCYRAISTNPKNTIGVSRIPMECLFVWWAHTSILRKQNDLNNNWWCLSLPIP